jgi:hypothetical protein
MKIASPTQQHCGSRTRWYQEEPSISEILADPIVRALMDADGVEPEGLASILGKFGK